MVVIDDARFTHNVANKSNEINKWDRSRSRRVVVVSSLLCHPLSLPRFRSRYSNYAIGAQCHRHLPCVRITLHRSLRLRFVLVPTIRNIP
jgi:hypothetical protein